MSQVPSARRSTTPKPGFTALGWRVGRRSLQTVTEPEWPNSAILPDLPVRLDGTSRDAEVQRAIASQSEAMASPR
jgi:hypothetical protein